MENLRNLSWGTLRKKAREKGHNIYGLTRTAIEELLEKENEMQQTGEIIIDVDQNNLAEVAVDVETNIGAEFVDVPLKSPKNSASIELEGLLRKLLEQILDGGDRRKIKDIFVQASELLKTKSIQQVLEELKDNFLDGSDKAKVQAILSNLTN